MTGSIDSFLSEWTDAEGSGDASSLELLLTDDFLGAGPLGFVLPKSAWLARFAGGLAYESFALEEIQSRIYGDAAVITARQVGRGTRQGSPLPFEAVRATLTVVRRAERWLMAGIHMSFLAGTPGAPPVPGASGPPAISGQEQRDETQPSASKEQKMSIEINHLIVPATDKERSARFLAEILGLGLSPRLSHFQPLQIGPVTLDYDNATDIRPMHIAFLVDDATFDAAGRRLLDGRVSTYADPGRRQPGQINHSRGGRGVYFDDPDGHLFELMTVPSGSVSAAQPPRAS